MPNYVVNSLNASEQVLSLLLKNETVDFDLIMNYTEDYGVKWNASETKRISSTRILFKTAWDAPHNVVKKLAVLSGEKILHEWASEDAGYEVGKAVYEKGKQTNFLDIGGTDEGYKLYEQLFSLML